MMELLIYLFILQLPLNTPHHLGHFTREGFAFWPFHTTDINQSCSQEVPNVNLFYFLFLLVDYHKISNSATCMNVQVPAKLSIPVLTVNFSRLISIHFLATKIQLRGCQCTFYLVIISLICIIFSLNYILFGEN